MDGSPKIRIASCSLFLQPNTVNPSQTILVSERNVKNNLLLALLHAPVTLFVEYYVSTPALSNHQQYA